MNWNLGEIKFTMIEVITVKVMEMSCLGTDSG